MGFGQYSAGGGICRTKPEMIEATGVEPIWSRKAGKNRVHYKLADGSQGFILHETIVAMLDASGTILTLADGGWHTPTTKGAWSDAAKAFDIKLHGTWTVAWWSIAPKRDERSVSYRIANGAVVERIASATPDPYLIRADVDDGGNFAVRWDGKTIKSDADIEGKASPFHILVVLHRIAALAKTTSGMITMRGNCLYQFSFDARLMGDSWTIHPGRSSKTMIVGCHTFKTADFAALRKRIAADYPQADKAARRFVKRHTTDFGMAAYEAERAARVAELQRRHAGVRAAAAAF